MARSPSVSIIIPVFNEAVAIVPTLQRLVALRRRGVEVIVVDGDSTDDTRALAQPLCDQLVGSARGRGIQMNRGAAEAAGDVLLFLHGDTILPPDADGALQAFLSGERVWGRFDVRLAGMRPIFRLIAFMMNLRSRLTGIATGDQAIFVRRLVFEGQGGFREIPLMEDIEFCSRLRRISRPFCIPQPVVTDSRRWEQNGIWRTTGLMWRLRWRYWRGADPAILAQAYRTEVRRSWSEPSAGPRQL